MSVEPLTYQSCPTIRRRVIGSNVWLLSFGDLVTLLLGFFVAIIAYAMQHPMSASAAVAGEGSPHPGTTIAVPLIDGADPFFRRQLVLSDQVFDPRTGALREDGANLLKSLIDFNLSTIRTVLVKSCFAEDTAAEGLARIAGVSRSLAIVSQLLDAGVVASVVEVGLPTRCKSESSPGGAEVTIVGSNLR